MVQAQIFKESLKCKLYTDYCLQCFKLDYVGWAAGRASHLQKKLSGWVLAWLSVWSKVQTWIWPSWFHCHSLTLASVKSRLVLPFWYQVEVKRAVKCVFCILTKTRFNSWPTFSPYLYNRVLSELMCHNSLSPSRLACSRLSAHIQPSVNNPRRQTRPIHGHELS